MHGEVKRIESDQWIPISRFNSKLGLENVYGPGCFNPPIVERIQPAVMGLVSMRDPIPTQGKSWNVMEGWSVADDHERTTNPMVCRDNRLLPWEKLPESIDPASIENLRVFSAETSAERGLPPYLRELSRLVDLIIPSTIVPSLRPEFLPDRVRQLRVDSEKGIARFSDHLAFTTVEELSSPFPLMFNAGAFPALQFIHLRLDKKRTMLKNSALPGTLKAMGIGPFNDPCIFQDLNVFELEWLAAYGTRSVSDIEGIGQLEGLEALRLFEFPRLTKLEPLLALKSLKELEICWCSRIEDYEPLLHLDSLEKVEFYFCDVKSVDSIRPALKAKGIKVHPAERQ